MHYKISTREDLVSLAFMIGLYGGLFLVMAYLGEPITLAGLGVLLIVLGIGSFAIISRRERVYRRLQDLLGAYAEQYSANDREE